MGIRSGTALLLGPVVACAGLGLGCGREADRAAAVREQWEREGRAADAAFQALSRTVADRVASRKALDTNDDGYTFDRSRYEYNHGVGFGSIEVTRRYRRNASKVVIDWIKYRQHPTPKVFTDSLRLDPDGGGSYAVKLQLIGYYKWVGSEWVHDPAAEVHFDPTRRKNRMSEPPYSGSAAVEVGRFPFADAPAAGANAAPPP